MTRAEIRAVVDRPLPEPEGFDPVRYMDGVVERTIRGLLDRDEAASRHRRLVERTRRWHAERSRR